MVSQVNGNNYIYNHSEEMYWLVEWTIMLTQPFFLDAVCMLVSTLTSGIKGKML